MPYHLYYYATMAPAQQRHAMCVWVKTAATGYVKLFYTVAIERHSFLVQGRQDSTSAVVNNF